MKKTMSHNVRSMTLASVGQKICAFIYFTILARYLGPEDVGKYVFTLSFAAIFVILIDLGLTSVLIREGARHKDRLEKYITTILSIKLPLGVFAYVLMILSVFLLGYGRGVIMMVALAGVTMFFDSMHMTFFGALRANGDLRYESWGMVGSQVASLILGLLCVQFDLPLVCFIGVFTLSSFLNLVFAIHVVRKKLQISCLPRFDRSTFIQVRTIAIPFAVAACAARVYSYVDSIILSKLAGDIAVGIYAIPYKITFAFQFIPLALIAPLYPVFSRLFKENKRELGDHFVQAVRYLAIIVFPLAIGLSVLAQDVIIGIYTVDYADSVLPLRILLVSLLFSFLGFPVGALLNACNRQATQTRIVLGVMLVNIVLNVVYISRFGAVAAASAALVGNMLLTIFGYCVVVRIITIRQVDFFYMLGKIFLTALVMGVLVWWSAETVSSFVRVLPVVGTFAMIVDFGIRSFLGILLYVIGLMTFKVVTQEECRRLVFVCFGKKIV